MAQESVENVKIVQWGAPAGSSAVSGGRSCSVFAPAVVGVFEQAGGTPLNFGDVVAAEPPPLHGGL